jgi:hypothetical protein
VAAAAAVAAAAEAMGDHEARGDDFEKKAEKKLSGWGLFSSKYEDAADLFDKAANSFKLAKNCERSWLPCPDPPLLPHLLFPQLVMMSRLVALPPDLFADRASGSLAA